MKEGEAPTQYKTTRKSIFSSKKSFEVDPKAGGIRSPAIMKAYGAMAVVGVAIMYANGPAEAQQVEDLTNQWTSDIAANKVAAALNDEIDLARALTQDDELQFDAAYVQIHATTKKMLGLPDDKIPWSGQ